MSQYFLNYLDELESEAIYVLREVQAQFQNAVILFSGGKTPSSLPTWQKRLFIPVRFLLPLCMSIQAIIFPKQSNFGMI